MTKYKGKYETYENTRVFYIKGLRVHGPQYLGVPETISMYITRDNCISRVLKFERKKGSSHLDSYNLGE